jgi:hypothetical protein
MRGGFMRAKTKRLSAMLLAIVLIVSTVSTNAYADADSSTDPASQDEVVTGE